MTHYEAFLLLEADRHYDQTDENAERRENATDSLLDHYNAGGSLRDDEADYYREDFLAAEGTEDEWNDFIQDIEEAEEEEA